MERICIDCHKPVKGRADKKFCDDLCRNNYNNRLKAGEDRFMTETNQILKKNRNILKAKAQAGHSTLRKEELVFKGFNFNFHTCCYQTCDGHTYFFCYDFGYVFLENDEVLLVRQ